MGLVSVGSGSGIVSSGLIPGPAQPIHVPAQRNLDENVRSESLVMSMDNKD